MSDLVYQYLTERAIRLKILVVSYYLPPNDLIGAGVQMHHLANAYSDLGHDVTLIAPVSIAPCDRKYRFSPCTDIRKNKLTFWSHVLRRYDYDYDFVHFAGCDHLVKLPSNVVHVRTFMGSSVAELLKNRVVSECLRLIYLVIIETLSCFRAQIRTVISEDTNRYLPRRGFEVPCGSDLQSFRPGKRKSVNPSILFVGILDSRKRGRKLLEIFENEVRSKIPTAELWVVRDATKVDAAGVTVYGQLSEEKLVELYQEAWVFCLPSSYEGFGVPYIEAMACGTPVVATPNPGALEVLDFGKFGVVTELDGIGNAIVSLLSNEQERDKYRELGIVRSKEYDILKVGQRYIDLVVEYRKRMLNI